MQITRPEWGWQPPVKPHMESSSHSLPVCLEMSGKWHINMSNSSVKSTVQTTDRCWMPLQLYTYLRSSATRRRSVSHHASALDLLLILFLLAGCLPRKTCRLSPLSGAPPYRRSSQTIPSPICFCRPLLLPTH
ncbi:hypothetical protein An14g04020 [Aspergillus niger]|uniref:Uncharacterized protein n=2 Tax=Aspergillus niger TaxID=5061 RepID=A2R3E6_ASPNC|nr:hypothetical protein An14g04020 [Aspergillus niger]CAK46638.1 hypothetical protein An14g04020 [Aspergillus niger]